MIPQYAHTLSTHPTQAASPTSQQPSPSAPPLHHTPKFSPQRPLGSLTSQRLKPPARISRPTAAFTLIQVHISLLVLALLAGGIMMAVSTSTKVTAIIGQEQMKLARLDAFVRLCRQSFLNLPGSAEVEIRARQLGSRGDALDLLLLNAPGTFLVGSSASQGDNVALSALPDGSGTATIALKHFTIPKNRKNDPIVIDQILAEPPWVKLIQNVEKISWRFMDPDTGEIFQNVKQQRTRPQILVLDLQLAGQSSQSYQFWIPEIEDLSDSIQLRQIRTNRDEDDADAEDDFENSDDF